MISLNKTIENSKHPELLVREKARVEELTKSFVDAGGQAKELSQILTYQGAEGARKFSQEIEKVNSNSYNNFRAVGQMDRITREFASGGLTSGLNGITMFGNSLSRLAVQEGGFKNALTGLSSAFTGPAGIVLGVSAVIGFFESYQKEAQKAKEETDKFAKSITDAKVKGTEQGLKLKELITISEDSNLSDSKRKQALDAVKDGISKVNDELGKQIKNSKDAKVAVDKLTEAYMLNAVVAIRNQKIAQDTIELEDAQSIINKAKPADIAKVNSAMLLEKMGGTQAGGAILLMKALGLEDLENAIKKSAILDEDLKKQQALLASDIENLKKNPFGISILTGNNEKPKPIKPIKDNSLEEYIKQVKTDRLFAEDNLKKEVEKQNISMIFGDTPEAVVAKEKKRLAQIETLLKPVIEKMKETGGLGDVLQKDAAKRMEQYDLEDARRKKDIKSIQVQEQEYKKFAQTLSRDVTGALQSAYDAMQKGQNPIQALGDAFARMAEQIGLAIIQAYIFKAILDAFPELKGLFAAIGVISGAVNGGGNTGYSGGLASGGITNRATLATIGESGPEAIMPLSKLGNVMNNSFNAGTMSSNSNSNNGQFVLRGSDLVLALQRSNVSLNLRRGA